MNPGRFSPTRTGWIAWNTLVEAVRQRLFVFMVVLAMLLVAGVRFLGEFNFGTSELKFIADFGFGALTLFGSVLAIVTTTQLFFSEIENRTALTLLAKPVRRSEFLLGKFAGVFGVLLVFVALVAGALLAVLAWREGALAGLAGDEAVGRGGLVSYGGIVLFALVQWLKFGVIAAFTLLIATYASTHLFTVFLGFLVLVICHLQHLALDVWNRLESGVARVAAGAVSLVFPNFQVFNFGDRIAAGQPFPWALAGPVAGYAGIYLVALLALAIFSFRHREV